MITTPVRFASSTTGCWVGRSPMPSGSASTRVFHETYAGTVDRVRSPPMPGRRLRWLRAAGATQSILSMWWHTNLVPEVSRHGLDHIMVRVEGNSGDGGQTKAGLLEKHLESLCNPSEPGADRRRHRRCPCGGGRHRCGPLRRWQPPRDVLRSLGVPIARTLAEAVTIGLTRGRRFERADDEGRDDDPLVTSA